MGPEAEQILLETYRRMVEHRQTPRPPDWRSWDLDRYDEVTDHGPEYGSGEWFGVMPEHQRMRYRRAIGHLEENALLITYRRHGLRLSHIRLSDHGVETAKVLLHGRAAGSVEPRSSGSRPAAGTKVK
jgi:hypothetical protein